jgi:hypothetical protein
MHIKDGNQIAQQRRTQCRIQCIALYTNVACLCDKQFVGHERRHQKATL